MSITDSKLQDCRAQWLSGARDPRRIPRHRAFEANLSDRFATRVTAPGCEAYDPDAGNAKPKEHGILQPYRATGLRSSSKRASSIPSKTTSLFQPAAV